MVSLSAEWTLPFFVIFLASYFFILSKIELRRFKYYDVYKLVFPIYLVVYIANNRDLKRIVISAINIVSLFFWYYTSF